MGPVTTNPWLISIINMTIVLAYWQLGCFDENHPLVDPTQKKLRNQ